MTAIAVALAAGGTVCASDLAWIVGRDETLVSQHARAPRAAGPAGVTRDGTMAVYEVTDRGRALPAAVAAAGPARA